MSSEQQTLKESVVRYCREHYDPQSRRRLLQGDGDAATRHWHNFAELGWLGATLPCELGGSGGSLIEAGIILEEFGRVLVPEPYLPCAILAAHAVALATDTPSGRALLEPMIHGSSLLSLAHGEGTTGHVCRHIETTARPLGTEGFILNGTKVTVLNGDRADCLIVSARLADDFALFAVGSSAPGLFRRSYGILSGTTAADVRFTDTPVPSSSILAQGEGARAAIEEAIQVATIGICFEALGSMSSVIDTTSGYLKTRRAYGTTLSSFQALQHRLANMLIELEMARSIVYHAVAACSQGNRHERRRATSAAKALVGRAAKLIGAEGIQLHGAQGMVDSYIPGQHFKHLAVVEGLFGDSDFHLRNFHDSVSGAGA